MTPAAVISGLGTWLPPRSVTNTVLAQELGIPEEWIQSRTGITRRHVVAPGISTGHLATEAGRRALESAGVAAVDAIVLATTTPDRPCPATAPVVAARLGMTGAAAVDLAAACTGFVYALAAGSGLIGIGAAGTVLVIGADAYSTVLDPTDRTTRPVFGDGAGAVVLRAGSAEAPGALLGFDLGSDGGGNDLLTIAAGGSEQRSTGIPAAQSDTYFRMRGSQVFLHAVTRTIETTHKTLNRVGWTTDDIDLFVPHQANLRILTSSAQRLGLSDDRVMVDLDRVGNTAAASIPLALAEAVARHRLTAGHRVVLTGFGGGLTWGSTALRWPSIVPR